MIGIIVIIAGLALVGLRGARESARLANSLRFEASMHRLLGADLIGWWNFDDPTARYRDNSGFNQHATCTSCPTVEETGVPGRGAALRFGGTQFLSVPHSPILSREVFGTSNNFTLSVWAQPFDWGAEFSAIINKAAGGFFSHTTAGIWASPHERGLECVMGSNVTGNPGGSIIIVRHNPGLNHWHHIACVADGINLRMYVDGVRRGSTPIAGLTHPRSENTAPLVFGRRTEGIGPTFNGLIDDIRIYNRGLTAQEIEFLYAQTKNRFLSETDN